MAKLLQEHERACKKLMTVHQGEEGSEFWAEFNMSAAPPHAYETVVEWNREAIDVRT